VKRPLSAESRRLLHVPILNRHTVRFINVAYDAIERMRGETRLSLTRGSFPMVGKESYFMVLGARGFREYQLLIPQQRFTLAIERIESVIKHARARCSLASLKLLDSPSGLLRFSGSGIALALDVPADGSEVRLFSSLDEVARETGSLINLSKDSRVSQDLVRDLFPAYDEFRSGIRAVEAGRRSDSALRRRILG
jgi:decaprenylphospho-beta-D-ribofuranose 2-oxidase